jgi:putative transposase
MRAIAQERRRFGYRRLHVLLKREGFQISHKKLSEFTGKRSWSLDFVSDQLTDGRRFCPAVIDDYTRKCLAPVARHLALGRTGGAGTGAAG